MFYWFLYHAGTKALQSAVADHNGNPDDFEQRDAMAWVRVEQDSAERFLAAWHRANVEICDVERGITPPRFRAEAIDLAKQTDRSIPQRIFNLTPDGSAVAELKVRIMNKQPVAVLRVSNLPAAFQAEIALGQGRRLVLADRARTIAEVH